MAPLFVDRKDAATYLAELGRLWLGWFVALVVLVMTRGWLTLVAAIVVLWVLVRLSRPIQDRVERRLPIASADSADEARQLRTDRDHLLRALAYGDEPIREASTLTGAGKRWLLLRHTVLAVTAFAFLLLVLDLLA